MKLKFGEKVYLQKQEISYILHEVDNVPRCIFNEIFYEDNIFFVFNASNAYNFRYAFEDQTSIEWLMAQDWIVDYEEYAKMSTTELETLCDELIEKRSAEIAEYNSCGEKYREKHYREACESFDQSAHKINSLQELIANRNGKIEFIFPEGYVPKTTNTPKNKPGLFARLFKFGAH